MYMRSLPNSSDHSAWTFWWQAKTFHTVTGSPKTTEIWLTLLWSPRNALLLHPSCFFFFFCTSRSSISLVPGSLPGLCLCYTTVPFRLRQGLKVSKLLGNQRSERSRIFLFSLSLLGGCWKITNALWKWGAAFWALLGIHVCEWTIYRYGKALLISELFRKEVPLGSPHFSSLFLKHHWVTLNLLPSWKTSLQSSLKKEKYPWTVKKTIPKGADHDLVTG